MEPRPFRGVIERFRGTPVVWSDVTTRSRDQAAGGSPGRPRDLTIDRAIVDATLAVVAEKGFEGTTVHHVASRAGIPKSTLYRRFASRDDLLRTVATEIIGQHPDVTDTGSLRGDLIALIGLLVEAVERRRNIVQLGIAAVNNPDLQPIVIELYSVMVDSMAELLERAAARGDLRSDIDPGRVLEMLAGQVVARFLGQQPADLSAAEQSIDLLLHGIGQDRQR
jgi:AcrR family transcriptional regulator